MKIATKLTARFTIYFVIFYLLIILGNLGGIFLITVHSEIFSRIQMNVLNSESISDNITFEDNQYRLDQSLIDNIEREDGEFCIVDANGQLVFQMGACEIDLQAASLSYEAIFWTIEDGHSAYFLHNPQPRQLFQQAVLNFTENGTLSYEVQRALSDMNATLELYDDLNLKEVLYGKKRATLNMYELLPLLERNTNHKEIIITTPISKDENLVLRMNNPLYFSEEEKMYPDIIRILMFLVIFNSLLLVAMLILSLLISRRFTRPIWHFLKQIQLLNKSNYSVIDDAKLKKNGQFKRPYRLYSDIDVALVSLTNTLESNERQLAQIDQMREDWIVGLSHDLKTPLSSIYGYAKMLNDPKYNWTEEKRTRFLQTIVDKAGYMEKLIKDLNLSYQLKNGGLTIQQHTVNLVTFIDEFLLHTDWQNVLFSYSSDEIIAEIDEIFFTRVLTNLLSNAKKYTKPNTCISLHLDQFNSQISIVIKDEGDGIPQEELEQLFNRYYRGTNTTDNIEGTGLGLAITKQLIEIHNGKIDIQSNSTGTIITILLPKLS